MTAAVQEFSQAEKGLVQSIWFQLKIQRESQRENVGNGYTLDASPRTSDDCQVRTCHPCLTHTRSRRVDIGIS
jgi:hypothetical protein